MIQKAIYVTRIFSTSLTPQLNGLSNLFITWFDLLVQFSAHYKFNSQYYCSLLQQKFILLCIGVFTVLLAVREVYCGL